MVSGGVIPQLARMILRTLPPWLKGIMQTRVAKATQHQWTTPTLNEMWDILEHRFYEYDPSRAYERWRALTPRVVKGQVSLIDLEDSYARWQRLLPLSTETPPHVIWEQLLSKLTVINSQGSWMVHFSGLEPTPGCAPFEKELRKYCAQRCTTVPETVSFAGPGGDS